MTDESSDGSQSNGIGRSISLVPVDHDPFNDAWASGSAIDPSGMVSLPTGGVGRSISLVPVDHDPFNESWANDPFNNSFAHRTPVDPPGMLPFYMSGQSIAPLQNPFRPGDPPSSMSSAASLGLPESPEVPTPPSRSVLFNDSPPPWEPRAPDRDSASGDQIDPRVAASGLPLSKSGVPFVPAPLSQDPALDLVRLVAPKIVDYFTKPIPPQAPFPSTPGKIPSTDNPYAGQALLEAAGFLGPGAVGKAVKTAIILPGLPLLRALARVAEEAAPGTAAKIIGATGVGPLATQIDRATLLRLSDALSRVGEEELARIGQEVAPGTRRLSSGDTRT